MPTSDVHPVRPRSAARRNATRRAARLARLVCRLTLSRFARIVRLAPVASLVAVAALSACRPDLGDRPSRVTRTRVLAIRSDPPEVHPGEPVTYALLVASPDGAASGDGAAWSYCTEPVLLTENTSVSAACTGPNASTTPLAARGLTASATVPSEACSVYGPEVPPGSDLRPRDPDATGGFYQPVRAELASEVAFGFTRLPCKLEGASADVATEYQARYVPNANPRLRPLAGDLQGRPIDLDHVPRGARVHLVAAWGEGAEGAEPYVVFDAASQTVVPRREAMRVSWFATDGTFDDDRTGRAEDDPATTTDNVWTAPDRAGAVHAWIVLRDARGGTDFVAQSLTVE